MLSQRKAMGMEESSRKRMDLCRVSESSFGRPAPKAWEQSGSMPRAKPERTE